jgi:hypothetical protein
MLWLQTEAVSITISISIRREDPLEKLRVAIVFNKFQDFYYQVP